MEIITFLKKKEYLTILILIILNIYIIIKFYLFVPKISYIIIFLIDIFILIIYNFLCIFLENEFRNNDLKLLQIRLESKLFVLSLIAHASIVFNYFFGYEFFKCYINYMNNCPYNLSNADYNLHLQRRCELYNINYKQNLLQYICSFNAELDFNGANDKGSSTLKKTDIKCSQVKSLIDSNEVIDSFVKEYNNEMIYYCDLKKQPIKYSQSIDYNNCQIKQFMPEFFIFINLFISLYSIFVNFKYFRNIKGKIY